MAVGSQGVRYAHSRLSVKRFSSNLLSLTADDSSLHFVFGANHIEQVTRHIEKDVNINVPVERLDGASNFLSGAFDP